MGILRKGHQAHVLAEKRLGGKYKSAVRAMHYDEGLELCNKERAILEIGKMKSPIGYQEMRLQAWESSERLLPRPY